MVEAITVGSRHETAGRRAGGDVEMGLACGHGGRASGVVRGDQDVARPFVNDRDPFAVRQFEPAPIAREIGQVEGGRDHAAKAAVRVCEPARREKGGLVRDGSSDPVADDEPIVTLHRLEDRPLLCIGSRGREGEGRHPQAAALVVQPEIVDEMQQRIGLAQRGPCRRGAFERIPIHSPCFERRRAQRDIGDFEQPLGVVGQERG